MGIESNVHMEFFLLLIRPALMDPYKDPYITIVSGLDNTSEMDGGDWFKAKFYILLLSKHRNVTIPDVFQGKMRLNHTIRYTLEKMTAKVQ